MSLSLFGVPHAEERLSNSPRTSSSAPSIPVIMPLSLVAAEEGLLLLRFSRFARNAWVGLPQTRMSSPNVSNEVLEEECAAWPNEEVPLRWEVAVVSREEAAEAVMARARKEAKALEEVEGRSEPPGVVDIVSWLVALPPTRAFLLHAHA